ncbi:DUF1963 domain-containing protein [Solirubrobacter soli]|uniref:DUF1963 domain-containing protein n=1 Tax=Solirubrobacter soli TaxID=363832 RepID=UPI0004274C7B|nr:DUF1963 domain-containing protein [Solirubrobacter soli]
MMRAFASLLLALLVAAPSAQAGGFRAAEVRRALDAAGFETIADQVSAASRPAVMIDRQVLRREPRERGTTRLGGRPDLPVGTAWPRCRGLQQSFLGQIRVRDLPKEAKELRRLGGSLLFFTVNGSADDEDRYDVWPGLCSAVVHAKAGAPLERISPAQDIIELKPARLRFEVHPDVPGLAVDADRLMAPLRRVKVTDYERWFEFHDALRGGRDERDHYLLGYLGTPLNPDPCASRTDRMRSPWRHLFTIDYDQELGFDIPDGGWLQIAISPADLRAGRFDRVCSLFNTT